MLKIAAQLLIYPPGILDPEKQEDKKKIQRSVADIFGTDSKPLTENFLKTLTQPNVTYKVAGKAETKNIEQIANSPEAGLAFSFFSSKRYQKPAEAATKTAPESDVKSDAADKTGESKDGGNTAKPVCSSFQNQTDCEAVIGDIPHRRKAVCGWIEGKFQDSSFLVNKNLALSMAAAFISFVGF
ncbi:Trypanosome variant surface glycoprotein C-terminal domain containing protein, putative [Trypanosoma equiperdum]|uniref:Trypanosome variant surface glycoprotein C-terminal domain containing protein, putative n=1 Tax=Trypanosoma equiperdum TaxID=5694 RepID=A0A1G4HZ61_TRYEQ|nr:Trypanosome variant surface glycoprotein C-terminal domain containing protein, putative [Trypanosoma equiperdum]